VNNSSVAQAQCVLRYQTLGNSSVAPVKLQQHLHTKYIDCKDIPIAFSSINILGKPQLGYHNLN
jgi:hypothetical protein